MSFRFEQSLLPSQDRLMVAILALLGAALATEVPVQGVGTPVYPVLCDPRTHGCVRHPPGCRSVHRTEPGAGCDYLAAWRRVGVHGGENDGVDVAIGGRIGASGGYVALGFKPSKGGSASEAGLLVCYKVPGESKVHLRLATYSSKMGLRFLSGVPDLLAEADSASNYGGDRPEQAGHYLPLVKLGFSALECRARLRLGRGLRGTPLEFLLNEPAETPLHPVALRYDGHHPLLMPGGDELDKPTWRYWAPARPLGEVGEASGPARTAAAKAHGCIMIIAWVLCASVGTLLARYYKLQWPARLLGKELAWFQVHRVLMAICCGLTLLAFIIIFADVAGYSGLDELPDMAHPILGIIVTILTLVNPLMSLARCNPGHPNRPWFNWIHWGVGTVAYLLAVVNLFLGLKLERAGALRSINYHIWILVFFVLFQFVIEIILEIHTLLHWKKNKQRWQRYQQDMQEYTQLLKQREAGIAKPQSRPVEPLPVGYCLRTFLLALHTIVAAAVALILFIVVIVY